MASQSSKPDVPWVLADVDPRAVEVLSETLPGSPAFATVLLNRGMQTAEAARRFLKPDWRHLHDPLTLTDMDRAVARVRRALMERERILIFGDYDVDGITATTVLKRFFSVMGHPVSTYIPDRLTEGYGLNLAAADRIVRDNTTDLVLTVDCGISDAAGVTRLKAAGIDVIVTDHHVAPDRLPPADALVNPMRLDCPYPFQKLAGVGVAFKFVWALATEFSPRRRMSEEFEEFLLEATALVALGTVCDMVPLLNENRVLVTYGLRSLATSPNPGLRALLDVAGLAGRPLEPVHLGFKIGPRINAAGRMGRPEEALALLTSTSYQEAIDYATRLDQMNTRRQNQERGVLQQVNRLLSGQTDRPEHGIVIAEKGWSPGITGIVASRLVDLHRTPAVLIAVQGEYGRGSGRSIPGFNLLEVLTECQDDLINFGGHAGAVGFTIASARVQRFVLRLGRHLADRLATFTARPTILADCELDLSDITPKLLREIEQLRPFGEGNPQPVFVARGLQVRGHPRTHGRKKRVIRFLVSHDLERPPCSASATSLNFSPQELKALPAFDMAYVPRYALKGGQGVLELKVRAVAPSSASGTPPPT